METSHVDPPLPNTHSDSGNILILNSTGDPAGLYVYSCGVKCVPVISARGLYLSTIQTAAAAASSPVELRVSDTSTIIAAGAQAGVNPISSAAIFY